MGVVAPREKKNIVLNYCQFLVVFTHIVKICFNILGEHAASISNLAQVRVELPVKRDCVSCLRTSFALIGKNSLQPSCILLVYSSSTLLSPH